MAKKVYRYTFESKEFRTKAIQALQENYSEVVKVGITDENRKFFAWVMTTGNVEADSAISKFMSEQYGFIKD